MLTPDEHIRRLSERRCRHSKRQPTYGHECRHCMIEMVSGVISSCYIDAAMIAKRLIRDWRDAGLSDGRAAALIVQHRVLDAGSQTVGQDLRELVSEKVE